MDQVAYTIEDAARTTATTRAIIEDEIRLGRLRLRRAGLGTPVILHTDLMAWVEKLPDYY